MKAFNFNEVPFMFSPFLPPSSPLPPPPHSLGAFGTLEGPGRQFLLPFRLHQSDIFARDGFRNALGGKSFGAGSGRGCLVLAAEGVISCRCFLFVLFVRTSS